MRTLTFCDNKLSLPIDLLSDKIAEKIQIFLDNAQSDYDRRQQQLADKEKALIGLWSLNDAAMHTYSQGSRLKYEIQQLFEEDLTSLWQTNPNYAQNVSNALVQKQLELKTVMSDLGQQEQELAQAQYAEVKRRCDEGTFILNQKYENFSTEKAPRLVKYMISKGVNVQDANSWAQNPPAAEMGYKAMLFEEKVNDCHTL